MTKKHLVILQPSGRRGQVEHGAGLRAAARDLGVEIESICAENATCGKCLVLVESGRFEKYNLSSSPAHLSPAGPDEAAWFARRPALVRDRGWEPGRARLACQCRVLGDVLVHVPEESRGNKQIVRKSAAQREIEIKPAIRNYYVELDPPSLSAPIADWERLAKGLETTLALVRRGDPRLPTAADLSIDHACLKTLAGALRDGEWKVTVSLRQDREVIRVQPGYAEEILGAAVDIGTTTLALYLCDLRTGAILAAESAMNPQIVYGEDVMSRIQYTLEHAGGLETMHAALLGTLNQLIKQAVESLNENRTSKLDEQGISGSRHPDAVPGRQVTTNDILEMVLVGNTTMQHLLLGLPPGPLGRAPYVPAIHQAVDLKARELGLQINASGNLHVLPAIASFIGADTSAVLLAEEPHTQDQHWLIIDVGTNAELVLGNKDRLVCTSTPTGPALEGAHIEFGMRAAPGAIERLQIDAATLEPRYQVIGRPGWNTDPAPAAGAGLVKGICGSAVIDAVAEMFRTGILDARGRFDPAAGSARLRQGDRGPEYVIARAAETFIGRDICLNQHDVRQIQLAKAALYAAARTLLRHMNLERPDKLILAGGFGSSIDKTNAMLIGLIPDMPLEDVHAVGNAAGDGARIALLNLEKRLSAAGVARSVQRFELPADPAFQDQFMQALNFPHRTEPFPHVAHLIPHRKVDPLAAKLTKGK